MTMSGKSSGLLGSCYGVGLSHTHIFTNFDLFNARNTVF